jgi:hypothetical protein
MLVAVRAAPAKMAGDDGHMKKVEQAQCSRREGDSNPNNGYSRRLRANPQQFPQIGLEANFKEEDNDPDFREDLDDLSLGGKHRHQGSLVKASGGL